MPQALMETLAADRGQAEEVAPLSHENEHADTGRKPHNHRRGYEADDSPHSGNTHQHEEDTRHESRSLESRNTVFRSNTRENGDKRTRGPRNLNPAATEDRHAGAADDRGIKPL